MSDLVRNPEDGFSHDTAHTRVGLTFRNASTVLDLPAVKMISLEWICSNDCWAISRALKINQGETIKCIFHGNYRNDPKFLDR